MKKGNSHNTKAPKVSDMLETETKKMEEKLELVKKMMDLEKQKRSQVQKSSQGSGAIWRGANTKQSIKGFGDKVLDNHKKTQPNLPPTTRVTNVNSQATRPLGQTNSRTNLKRGPSAQGSRKSNRPTSKTSQRQNASSKNFVGDLSVSGAQVQGNRIPPSAASVSKNVAQGVADQNQEAKAAPATAQNDQNDSAEVKAFLEEMKLNKYFDKLVDNGVEDLETILELKDEHIEQMGIPLGHKLKILKKIKDIRSEKGMSVPQSRQGTRRDGINTQGSQAATNSKTQDTSSKLESSSNSTREQSEVQSQQTSSSLKNGQYDEKESHSEFLEALAEWRAAAKSEGEQKQQNDGAQPAVKKVTFGESENFQRNSEIHVKEDADALLPIKSSPQKKKISKKLSCWNCYKLYFKNDESDKFQMVEKTFCTELCYNLYNKSYSEKCSLATCEKVFLKADKPYLGGRWFCCDECAELDPKAKEIIDMIDNPQPKAQVQAEPETQYNEKGEEIPQTAKEN